MAITKFGCWYLLLPALALGQSAATVGTLHGVVKDSQGAAILGAQITYRRLYRIVSNAQHQPMPAPGEAVTSGIVTVDAIGGFTLSGLPSGNYVICGSARGFPYIDPCKWASAPIVSVAANATTSYVLTLTKGVFLNVRINDPTHQLQQALDGPLSPRKLIVGVKFGSGAYQGAQNISVDANGRNYQIAVPAGIPMRLWLFSRDLALSDASGSAVNTVPGAAISFSGVVGVDQNFTFGVTGALKQAL
jgi:hypothetical protein